MNRQEILLSNEVFNGICQALEIPKVVNKDFIYKIYCMVIPEIEKLNSHLGSNSFYSVNPLVLANYIISEHFYSMTGLQEDGIKIMEENEQYATRLSTIVFDKYYTNEKLGYITTPSESKYYPPISSLTLYLNFILNTLSKYEKGNPDETLIIDFLAKAFTMAKGIISLLTQGFETEAFSIWRTFHETECIVKILNENSAEVIKAYLKHMDYGFAFRDVYADKSKQDQIFVEIKEQMRLHNLKSKDMKKFIEYGWLHYVPALERYPNFKLNFRDGVEEVAGLSEYSKWYEMSSELAHSSPLLIYANKKFFFDLTLLATLESFLRVEEIFDQVFTKRVNEKLYEGYQHMRRTYRTQLQIIHEVENKRFKQEHNL